MPTECFIRLLPQVPRHAVRKRKKEAKAIHSVDGGTVQYIGCAYDNWQVTAPDGKIWKAVSDSSLIDRNSSAEVVTSCLS